MVIDMWVAGWNLARYGNVQGLPMTHEQACEWWEGFRAGAIDMSQYGRLYEYLAERLQGYDATLRLVMEVARPH
jgi:hypothetical protein